MLSSWFLVNLGPLGYAYCIDPNGCRGFNQRVSQKDATCRPCQLGVLLVEFVHPRFMPGVMKRLGLVQGEWARMSAPNLSANEEV